MLGNLARFGYYFDYLSLRIEKIQIERLPISNWNIKILRCTCLIINESNFPCVPNYYPRQ